MERAEGDGFCRGPAEGDMARRPRFPLAALHAGRGVGRAEGDIPEFACVALVRVHDSRGAGGGEGYGLESACVSLTGCRARRGAKRAEGERERLPRALLRRPDAAGATGRPEGDGFWHETGRGRRILPPKRLPCRLLWHLGADTPVT